MKPQDSVPRDLLRQPLWRPEDLGQPLPQSVHANSVCLPTWADVIDYEESRPRVLSRLQTGYPRFFIHPLTERFFQACVGRFARGDEFCHAYPSPAAAQRCLESLRRWSGHEARIEAWGDEGPFVVCFPRGRRGGAETLAAYGGRDLVATCGIAAGRNTRCRQSNRQADRPRADRQIVRCAGRLRVSVLLRHERHLRRLSDDQSPRPGRMSVQFGFPYVDTLKIQQDMGLGAHFLPHGDEADLQQLQDLVRGEPISAVFCEFPSNPLLVSPNLAALSEVARRHEFPLVVDETLGTYVNTDVLRVADVAVTSLTKYFTGAGDVLAGAAIINPQSPLADRFHAAWDDEYEDTLWDGDAVLLAQYSADFPGRVQRINHTAELVWEFCRSHPAVAEVYSPQDRTLANYAAFQRPGGGYGGLFSLLLKDPERIAPRFFDALQMCKGPNLGVHFSLCCPFTLLAHYRELDFVERCGVSRYLIRISVGLEEPQDLIERLDQAISNAEKRS